MIQYHINLFDKDKAINLDKAFQLNLFKCALSIFWFGLDSGAIFPPNLQSYSKHYV